MSVGSGVPYNSYTGNGVSTVFAFGFTLLDANDLVVTIDGVVTSSYTISGIGVASGGAITFTTAPANGSAVLLARVMQLVRATDYQDNGDLLAPTLNNDLDRPWMAIQQVAAENGRALRVPEIGEISALPAASLRANLLLGFDSDGDVLLSAPASGSASDLAINLAKTTTGSEGARLVGYGSGRTLFAKVGERKSFDNDFGGDPSAADNTAAFAAASAYAALNPGVAIYMTPGKVYTTGKFTAPASGSICFYSDGAGATIKAKAGLNDHLFLIDTAAQVWLSNISFDGNRSQNRKGSVNQAVIFNKAGYLVMFGGTVSGGVHDQILSGNVDYGFSAGVFAQLMYLNGVTVNGGTASDLDLDGLPPQDCYRIFRTKTVRLIDCRSTGGLSGARIGYYCDDVEVIGGKYASSYGDVGVTVYFTSRFVVSGVTSTGHFQHGLEIDAANNGTVSNCVLVDNAKNGLMMTEYGPPGAGAQYAGTYDTVTTVYGTKYPCRSVAVTGCVMRRNGLAGVRVIGQGDGVSLRGNTIEGNNTTNSAGENCGLFIDGGTLNDDGVIFGSNTFINTGNQLYSGRQSNVQYRTRSEGNTHVGGRTFEYAMRGPMTSFNRGSSFDASRIVSTYKGTVVQDSLATPGRWARQITDSSTGAVVLLEFEVPAPTEGHKLVVAKLRTPDTMTSVDVFVDLYDGATSKATAFTSTVTLTAAYQEVVAAIPTTYSVQNYDRVRVRIQTSSALTGKVNVAAVEVFGDVELSSY